MTGQLNGVAEPPLPDLPGVAAGTTSERRRLRNVARRELRRQREARARPPPGAGAALNQERSRSPRGGGSPSRAGAAEVAPAVPGAARGRSPTPSVSRSGGVAFRDTAEVRRYSREEPATAVAAPSSAPPADGQRAASPQRDRDRGRGKGQGKGKGKKGKGKGK